MFDLIIRTPYALIPFHINSYKVSYKYPGGIARAVILTSAGVILIINKFK